MSKYKSMAGDLQIGVLGPRSLQQINKLSDTGTGKHMAQI